MYDSQKNVFLKVGKHHPPRPHSLMDKTRASEARDAGSIPAGDTTEKYSLFFFILRAPDFFFS